MEKKDIRKKILDMRRELTSKYIEDASEKIFETITQMERVCDAQNILIYSNFDNEVKTAKLTGWLLYKGKNVYFPTVDGDKIHAVNIKSAVLEMNGFGFAQPKLEHAEILLPERIDLVVVPGIVFDRSKNRIGFGGGYYDAYLPQAKNAYKIAIAYDFQLFDHIPSETHDVRMDVVITPDEVVE